MTLFFHLVGCPVEFVHDAERFLASCVAEAGFGESPSVVCEGYSHEPTHRVYRGVFSPDGEVETAPRRLVEVFRGRTPDGGSYKVWVTSPSRETFSYDEAEPGFSQNTGVHS